MIEMKRGGNMLERANATNAAQLNINQRGEAPKKLFFLIKSPKSVTPHTDPELQAIVQDLEVNSP